MEAGAPEIAVFGSSASRPHDGEWEAAVRCGRLLAEAGMTVVAGGYGGTMEAVSQGASAAGGHVIGVIAPAVFPARPGANRYVVEIIDAPSLAMRLPAL